MLPHGEGYAYESGLHARWSSASQNFKQLADHERGTRTDGFVSFIDFGPTVLNLAGLSVPEDMDGSAFFGKGTTAKELSSRNEAFGYADRFDEKYDLVRTSARESGNTSEIIKVSIRTGCRTTTVTGCLPLPNGGSFTRRANSTPTNGNFSNPAPRNNCSIFRRTPTR